MQIFSQSKLGLGTAQFGFRYGISNQQGRPSASEVKEILEIARKNKIDTIDTAMAYGKSEEILGQNNVSSFNVITKIPPIPNELLDINSWIDMQVNNSLHKLKIKKIYGMLFHRASDLITKNGVTLLKKMELYKSQGIIKKIGVSVYQPEELEIVWDHFVPDIIQTPYNVFDTRIETSGWLSRLQEARVEVHVRSIFLQGLLLMDQSEIPHYFKGWEKTWNIWFNFLMESNLSALEVCLNLVVSRPEISRVIIGVDSTKQLTEIVKNFPKSDLQLDLNFLQSDDPQLINPYLWPKFN